MPGIVYIHGPFELKSGGVPLFHRESIIGARWRTQEM